MFIMSFLKKDENFNSVSPKNIATHRVAPGGKDKLLQIDSAKLDKPVIN
jgi:AAA+ superfamily predicted ATPase